MATREDAGKAGMRFVISEDDNNKYKKAYSTEYADGISAPKCTVRPNFS